MRIAIPLVQGKLSAHFGHCEQFALVDVNDAEKKVVAVNALTPPPHEPGVLPRWLHEQGADVIVAGGMGARAQQLFAAQDIKVIVGAPVDEPETLALAYIGGTLTTGINICDH